MASIILMEDDEAFSEVMAEMLKSRAHSVTTCRSATQARTLLEQTQFDLLITDLVVYHDKSPVADGGISLITWLRGVTSASRPIWLQKLPIIAISGAVHRQGMVDILQVAKDLGADMTLTKPTKPDELFEAINSLARR